MHKDIIIIGAGVVGCSIARELSRYNTSILVLEKENDVSVGTSKANSGIAHAGFDAKEGSLKAKFNVEGNKMMKKLSEELDFPFKQNGAMVLGFEDDSIDKIEELYHRGIANGVEQLRIIRHDEILKLEPEINDQVQVALLAPTSGIVSPYEMTIAYAENAASNGVTFVFGAEVNKIDRKGHTFVITTTDNQTYECETLINCAGVYADKIYELAANKKAPFQIVPRKGEYCLLDKTYGYLTSHTLFQTPTKMGKGVLVTPTTHDNIIVGPNAHDEESKDDVDTSIEGLNEVWNKALLTMPHLPKRGIITQFAGLRAHAKNYDDFIVGYDNDVLNLYNVAAIESPGLTSAPAIAVHVAKEVAEKMKLSENKAFNPIRKGIPHFAYLSNEEREALIKENPLYGHIICRCEVVSEGEIVEAIRRVPGAKDLDGVKRRTRAGMGRCQMGFCTPKVMEIIARELHEDITSVTKKGHESFMVDKR